MTEQKRGPGRPPIIGRQPTQQIAVLLPPELVEKARRIGGENLTEGVRKALREYREN